MTTTEIIYNIYIVGVNEVTAAECADVDCIRVSVRFLFGVCLHHFSQI